jgi:hypothetical protein
MSVVQRVQVDLEVSSWIEGRGVRHTHWTVGVNDAMVEIEDLRDVGRTATDPELSFYDDEVDEMRVLPPGCQYRITYHPRLPVGTRVQKRISTPLAQPPNKKQGAETVESAFQRFMAAGYGRKLPLKTVFTDFRVAPRGLVTEEAWQRSQQRGSTEGRRTPTRDRQIAGRSDAVTPGEMAAFLRDLSKIG